VNNRIHISELANLQDSAGNLAAEEAEDPATICSNFRFGCNGVTEGADNAGYLTLCDDCNLAEGFLLAGR
jgi:hypothetical protein